MRQGETNLNERVVYNGLYMSTLCVHAEYANMGKMKPVGGSSETL